MTRRLSMGAEYFTDLYARDPDPWNFSDSAYEAAKYAETLSALPRDRFARALEVGCSIGVLTRSLAARCDALLAIDVAEQALRCARERCMGLPVEFRRMRIPDEWPAGTFDLILLSEVLYYLTTDEIDRVAARVAGSLREGGCLMLVHWTGPTDYPLSGDDASERLITGMSLPVIRRQRTQHYRMDILQAKDSSADSRGPVRS